MSYLERLKVPIDDESAMKLYTRFGLLISKGYQRIVIGDRGPYVEFREKHLLTDNLKVPKEEDYREKSVFSYYIELRTIDEANVKVYLQKKLVDYADYRIGRYYISAFDLLQENGENLIEPIKKKAKYQGNPLF